MAYKERSIFISEVKDVFMNSCTRALIDYFQQELPNLKRSYQWKTPNIEGFERSGEYGYQPNIELKKYLNTRWNGANKEERYRLAKTIVSDWGGVKSNRPETLNAYVEQLDSANPATPIKGIASYSKIFAVADMEHVCDYPWLDKAEIIEGVYLDWLIQEYICAESGDYSFGVYQTAEESLSKLQPERTDASNSAKVKPEDFANVADFIRYQMNGGKS